MKYLLDTNVCVAHLRGKNALVLQRFGQHPPTDLVLCSVVVGELCYGALKSTAPTREPGRGEDPGGTRLAAGVPRIHLRLDYR